MRTGLVVIAVLIVTIACGSPSDSSNVTERAVEEIDRAAYGERVSTITRSLSSELSGIMRLLEIGAFDTPVWQADLRKSSGVLAELYDQARGVQPPDDLQQIHDTMILALEHYAKAGELLELTMLDSNDTGPAILTVRQAIDEIGLGHANIAFANELFEKEFPELKK